MKEESELKKEFQKIMKQHYFLKSDPELPYDNILSCMEDAYNLDRPTPAVETKTAEEITDNAFNQFWNKIMDSVCNHLNLSDDEALSLRCHVSEIEHDEFADQILNLFTPSAKSVEVEEAAKEKYGNDPNLYAAQRDGFKEGYQLGQSSQQGWIDVKERLPEEGVYVLAITKYRRIVEQSWEGFTDQNKGWFERNFTHWMPLPNPPTPTNKDTQNS